MTGSHIPQRVDLSSGLPATISPLRVYFRDELLQTGHPGLASALSELGQFQ